MAGPNTAPQLFGDGISKLIANNLDYFNGVHRNGTKKSEFNSTCWFNFYGGARDVLVATPSNIKPLNQGSNLEMTYVTTEMKHVYESVDHNS